MRRWIFIVFILLSNMTSLIGQQVQDNNIYTIKGKVVSEEDELPVEYATVGIFSLLDSSLLDGTVTDVDGRFNLKLSSKNNQFYVRIDFISFKSSYIPLKVISGKSKYELGTIKLQTSAQTLEEFTVEAEHSRLEFNMDKKTFNVGKDLSSIGGSATDVLENVPSISVDEEGNVSLRGSQGVKILIDGRPSGLIGSSPSEALKQIPADMIEKVEIVTNPSAKYQASGSSGIINIILKRKKEKGINGTFSGTVGYPDNYQASVNLNFRKNAWNVYGGYNFRYSDMPGRSASERETFGTDTNIILIQDQQFNRGHISHLLNFGLDYFAKNNNQLGFNISSRIADGFVNTNLFTSNQTNPISFSTNTMRKMDGNSDNLNLDASFYYTKKFKNNNQKLSLDMSFSRSTENDFNEIEEAFSDEQQSSLGIYALERTSTNELNQNGVVQIDYEHPFKNQKLGKLEAGYRGNYRQIGNKFSVENADLNTNEWLNNIGLTNTFEYNESVQAGYLTYSNKLKEKLKYKLGLRAEYTYVLTVLKNTNEKNKKNYMGLFPTAHFSYAINKKNNLQLGYSRRIERPGMWTLNPFFSYSNPYNFWGGNPDVNPEYTDVVEFGYIYYGKKLTLGPSVYYNYSSDNIFRITTVDSLNISRTIPENLGFSHKVGIEFVSNYQALKWWKIDLSLNGYYVDVNNDDFDPQFSSQFFSWSAKLNSKMTFWKNFNVILTGAYRAQRQTAQGIRKPMYYMDIGISKDIIKGKGNIALKVSDIFNSRRYEGEFGDDTYTMSSLYQRRSRMVYLRFTYRLNNNKKIRKHRPKQNPNQQYGGSDR